MPADVKTARLEHPGASNARALQRFLQKHNLVNEDLEDLIFIRAPASHDYINNVAYPYTLKTYDKFPYSLWDMFTFHAYTWDSWAIFCCPLDKSNPSPMDNIRHITKTSRVVSPCFTLMSLPPVPLVLVVSVLLRSTWKRPLSTLLNLPILRVPLTLYQLESRLYYFSPVLVAFNLPP